MPPGEPQHEERESVGIAAACPGRVMMLAVVSCWGCATSIPYEEPSIPRTLPSEICTEPTVDACLPASTIEGLLRNPRLTIVEATGTPGGAQGARVLTLEVDGVVTRAKWRAEGRASSILGSFSEPRRGAVAYHVQKLFLDEDQIVVPPTVGYCFPLEVYREKVDEKAKANVDSTDCVFGFLSYWLSDVEAVSDVEVASDVRHGLLPSADLYSEQRFAQDPLYARKLARLNALTYLVDHDDAHAGQFLVSEDPFHVWSVDHSMSLTSVKNPMVVFLEDWSKWKLPSMPRTLAERLRSISRGDIESLRRIESYDAYGPRLVPRGPGEAVGEGLHPWGTTNAERRLIWRKVQRLLRGLDRGDITTF